MNDSYRQLRVPDGRQVEVLASPPTGGWTLVYHHGTPGAPGPFEELERATASRGIRLVQFARPGYAGSDRLPDRSVGDVAADVAAILDEFGVERCLTLGSSGGGPHSIACAALLPDRVAAAGTIAAVAPYPADGLDWLAGMGADNVEEFGASLAGAAPLRTYLEAMLPALSGISADQVADALGDLVPPVDRAALTGAFAEAVAFGFRRALSTGIWGWYDDDIAFVRPWGFELGSIRVPVSLWQGGQDRMVPFAHGTWLAERIPGVRPHLLPDEGHLSLDVVAIDRVVDELVELAASA